MDNILYARQPIYMKRKDIIQNIIEIFTRKPVRSLSICSNRMERISPTTTMSKIPYKRVETTVVILSHL